MKRIYRSKTDKKIAGVCAGLANMVNFDPSVIRIIWALVTIISIGAPGVIAYIVCALIIPVEPDSYDTQGKYM